MQLKYDKTVIVMQESLPLKAPSLGQKYGKFAPLTLKP